MKWALAIVAIVVAGCMAKVTVDKRPAVALPIYSQSNTNLVQEYVIVDQGYKVRYMKIGFNTDIQSMSAEITTNKTVNFQLGGLHSNVATNGFIIKMEDLMKISQMFREGYITN
jgi:hypothetical protein